jgi:REP element-mobilizing transposase RayT
MANTYTSLNYHLVFSTKNREPWLIESVCERLWPYLAGIARENGMKALEICGVTDHVHILVSVPASMALSKAVQLIKGGSSHWIKESFSNMAGFAWQDGYGAFTVSESQLDTCSGLHPATARTPPHEDVAEEYKGSFSKVSCIKLDERYLFG